MLSVPNIPQDLRHEETIIQAAHALICLEKTITSIFDTINNRIEKNEKKLQVFNNRIKKAHNRLAGSKESGDIGLIGSKKSIIIYAPSRFPCTQILREAVTPTFSKITLEDAAENNNQLTNTIKSRVNQLSPNEKLVFFHVRSEPSRTAARIPTSLGPIPEDIKYVTSTLRFNSDDFVYDSGCNDSTDLWRQARLFKRDKKQLQQGTRGQKLPPAPHSLTHQKSGQAARNAINQMHYTPRLNDLPDMDLPMDLPDLPGIADDIQFIAQEQQRIAPSLLIEDLPDLEELEKQQQIPIDEPRNNSNSIVTTETLKHTKEETQSVLPVPPPPAALSPIVSYPPPPPPPPPPATLKSADSSNATDMRSDLMAAIRKAGGVERARLRPAAPINALANDKSVGTHITTESNENPASQIAGGGLMAELHNKLQMRRKGISGDKDKAVEGKRNDQRSDNPLLSNLSSLIPQAKLKSQVEQEDDEDDWAD